MIRSSSANGQLKLLDRLIAEFAGDLPVGVVIRCVAVCAVELRRLGVDKGLDDALESMARTRLRRLAVERVWVPDLGPLARVAAASSRSAAPARPSPAAPPRPRPRRAMTAQTAGPRARTRT
jgi:hypothetical protein